MCGLKIKKGVVPNLNGSPTWIRTKNPLVNSEVLYH